MASNQRTYFLTHLAADMRKSLLAIETHGLQTSVTQHLRHLCVLLTILAENKLTLVVIVLVLSPPPILSTLQGTNRVSAPCSGSELS